MRPFSALLSALTERVSQRFGSNSREKPGTQTRLRSQTIAQSQHVPTSSGESVQGFAATSARRIERALLAFGLVLLATYGAMRIDSIINLRAGLRKMKG